MRISGYRNRRVSIADSSAVAFDLDMEVTSSTGEVTFGVSGFLGNEIPANSRKSAFTFKSGRVFDPEGRNVYSYLKNKNVNLKGTFLSETYDYFIDNNLVCSIGKKDDFKISNFFFDSDGCEIEINDFNIYAPVGTLDMTSTLNADVFGEGGVAGEVGSANAIVGSSGPGDTMIFEDALTFNKNTTLKGSVLSGEVTLGHEFFTFDNSQSYIADLTDVAGGGLAPDLKPLNLISKNELARGIYPIEIDFYTTFGNITAGALITANPPDNPSGIKVNVLGAGYPLQSGGHIRGHSLLASAGDPVSGEFYFHYSADVSAAEDSTLGLPYKIYLEHVEGDHSKKYAFLTGIELSGSGLNYDVSNGMYKSVRFRSGDMGKLVLVDGEWVLGVDSPEDTDGATLGESLLDEGSGLISRATLYNTMMTEAHMSSIRTNLYTGDIDISDPPLGVENMNLNIGKMRDGHLLTRYPNTGIADIVTILAAPDGVDIDINEQPSGVAKVFCYTKPVSDWKLFTGDPAMSTDTYVEHTVTGIKDTPLRRHKYIAGENEIFLRAVIQAKNYVDSDPMVYRLNISGADGFTAQTRVTGTVMDSGYELPFSPIL